MKSRTVPIESSLFTRNRQKLKKLMGPETWAIACANPLMHRNGDVCFPFRQDSDFFYLTGIAQEDCFLFVSPDTELLFIPMNDPKNLLWRGELLGIEEARSLSGIEDVRPLDELENFLGSRICRSRALLFDAPAGTAVEKGGRINGAEMQRKLDAFCPGLERTSLSDLLAGLRMIKEAEEVDAIRKACRVTGEAFERVLQLMKAGISEYVIEAEMTSAFIASGSPGHAYEPIIASGRNALILHYVENRGICEEGDMVLLDFGAEWNNYASDCSRTLPVNGRFSRRQMELYRSTMRVFEQSREMMHAGIRLADFQKQVGALWEEEHIILGLYSSREAGLAGAEAPLWRKYFMHGISHSMGLDVHDPFDRERAFEAGMVLTCEPGIYIPEEGVGIRLENDILISESGPVDLMKSIPMDPEELETIMNGK